MLQFALRFRANEIRPGAGCFHVEGSRDAPGGVDRKVYATVCRPAQELSEGFVAPTISAASARTCSIRCCGSFSTSSVLMQISHVELRTVRSRTRSPPSLA